MATLRIYQDSRAFGTCRSCGAPVEWADLTTGKRHPFDRPIRVSRSQTSLVDGRVIDDVDTATSPTHFATCPDAKHWRRERAADAGYPTARRRGGLDNR
jgi:hypothetical protein